jgi:hypothetical protein
MDTPIRPGGAWRNIRESSSGNIHHPIPPRSTRPPVASRPIRNIYLVGDGPINKVSSVTSLKVHTKLAYENGSDAQGAGKENQCPPNAAPIFIKESEKQPKEIQVDF